MPLCTRLLQRGLGPAALAAVLTTAAHAQPAHDLCENATVLTTFPFTETVPVGFAFDDRPNECSVAENFEVRGGVWYVYTAAQDTTIRIDATSTYESPIVAVYGSCGGITPFLCSPRQSVAVGVTAGNTLRFLVGVNSFDPLPWDTELTVSITAPGAPANDSCQTPATLAFPSVTEGTTMGARSDEQSNCSTFYQFGDVWYSFTAPVTGRYEFNTEGSFDRPVPLTDTMLSLFAACGGIELACSDHSEFYGLQAQIKHNLAAGQRVLVRMSAPEILVGDFTLNVLQAPPLPVNDDCANAETLQLDTPVSSTTLEATREPEAPNCGSSTAGDVWYRFTAAAAGRYQFVARRVGGGFQLPTIAVVGGCGGDTLACADSPLPSDPDAVRARLELSANQTVLLRVAGAYFGDSVGFEIAATLLPPLPPAPANDTCDAALDITAALPYDQAVDTTSATPDAALPVGTCNFAPEFLNSVWYRFSPTSMGELRMEISPTDYPVMAMVLGGDCATATERSCVTGFPNIEALHFVQANQTYLIGVGQLGPSDGEDGGPTQVRFSFTPIVITGTCCTGATCATTTLEACTGQFSGGGTCDLPFTNCCRANFDRDGAVQVADIFAFLRAWFAMDPKSDFDRQNGTEVADIFAFLRAWFAGC